ncbi:MHC class II regulatory factor RFX1 [Bagarius yarrelli]|uniref:MHC class II regulatory factor RFX1 n=1 Tax=Bagarius yarrelli TaxID=175774 RepID=A0A556TL57_BAGYA|nr:MHC class II regulatory factor RFX1 [Bagarius yarrelli]
MATPGYTEELQHSQPQGGSVSTPKISQQKAGNFLPDIQSSSSSSQIGLSSRITQTAPPATLKKAILATPTQTTAVTQYAVSEIQSSAGGSCMYSFDTAYQGSNHSNDSVSDSSPPPTVQTGVPTHVVQSAQQRSVVQTAAKSGQHGVSNLHITPEVGHVYSSQVQYVDGDSNYNNTSIRSSSYPFTESSLYGQATPSGPYYNGPPTTGSQVSTPVTSQPVSVTSGFSGGGTGVTVVSGASSTGGGGGGDRAGNVSGSVAGGGGEGAYVVPGSYVMGSGGQNYTHNIRASPATVQWLLDNYEKAEGVSLPRCTLYYHYLLHCQEAKLEPVNAASFGKLIRSLFIGLRTRRLGTRGNSKYHYYGLRIKSSSPLHRLMEDQQHLAMRQQPFSHKHRCVCVCVCVCVCEDASRSLPEFPEIDLQGKALPEGILLEHIRAFQQLYREHCEAIVDVVVNLQFPLVETLWKSFWRFSEGQTNEALDLHSESEKRLPKVSLVLLCQYEPVLQWSRNCDNTLYQTLVEILIPNVLTPIPSALTQAIRNCAKSLENWLTSAMMNIPEEMQQKSLEQWAAWLDSVVTHVLKPYTSSPSFAKAAKLFLLKWGFYSSMVIRDLTLRSAASFGSFHLIRLLYDEYMYYLVEHKVAQAKGETPIAFASLGRNNSTTDVDKEEDEEEEDESDEDQMPIPVDPTAMEEEEESLEPPTKLARTDLFSSTHD